MTSREKPQTGQSESGEEKQVTLTREEYELLREKAKELEATRDKLLRNAADYDNARKRLAREREEFIKFSQERILRELLPILDNFERALTHLDEKTSSLTTGLQLILKQLSAVLTHHGLRRFKSEGEAFDPHLHEAVEQVEEEGPEGMVIQEVLPGYLLHDRVIRPAKVRVRVRPASRVDEKAQEKEEEIT